jgi:hypothetical protein
MCVFMYIYTHTFIEFFVKKLTQNLNDFNRHTKRLINALNVNVNVNQEMHFLQKMQ